MKHAVIPDTQIKPGVPMEQLVWAGQYIADKRPDRIIHLGDHWDMPSLCSYDVGKKSFEGRRYIDDIEAGREGMRLFLEPIIKAIEKGNRNHRHRWNPTFHFLMGNHEFRINKAIESDPKLEGVMGLADLGLDPLWDVADFLEPIDLDGVHYSHYWCTGVMGRPCTSARAMLMKKHQSCIMGHVQKRDIAYDYTADGRQITGIFAGAFYQHDEEYLNPQGNRHWRGIWMLHDIRDGSFDEMPVSISYLEKYYKERNHA